MHAHRAVGRPRRHDDEDAAVLRAGRAAASGGTDAGGLRDYDESALDRLTFVKAAQAAGMALGEIRQVIAARERTEPPRTDLAELLDVYIAELEDRLALLLALRAELQRLRERTTTPPSAECGDTAACRGVRSA